ncbi:MAG: 3'-5' exonuclease [Thermoanaerobaculia bacterium]
MRVPNAPHRLLALDLETTGLDPRRDAIVAVGSVPVEGGSIRWGERRRALVDDPRSQRPRDLAALGVHQTLPSEQRGGIPLAGLLDLVAGELDAGGALLVHGASLERGFLDAAARAEGRRDRRFRAVCTLAYLRAVDRYRHHLADRLPRDAARHARLPTVLGEARALFGLPDYPPHEPLYDALGTAELYLLLSRRFPELHPGVGA